MKKISDKLSWRIYVIAPIVIFAIAMICMVVIAMRANVDLVTENYYEQELKYQQQIDLKNNASLIADKVSFETAGEREVIMKTEGAAFDGKSGEIKFYRPSDASKDFTVVFMPDEKGIQRISHQLLGRGLWKIRLDLADSQKSYAVDKTLFME